MGRRKVLDRLPPTNRAAVVDCIRRNPHLTLNELLSPIRELVSSPISRSALARAIPAVQVVESPLKVSTQMTILLIVEPSSGEVRTVRTPLSGLEIEQLILKINACQ